MLLAVDNYQIYKRTSDFECPELKMSSHAYYTNSAGNPWDFLKLKMGMCEFHISFSVQVNRNSAASTHQCKSVRPECSLTTGVLLRQVN